VAFSRAATPYWVAEVPDDNAVPRIADRPRSPERGQLLAGLAAAGVDVPELARDGATFADADLRGAVLRGAVLRGADLDGGDLYRAVLRGADLRSAVLRGADLRNAVLDEADLGEADLSSADLSGALLRRAVLRGAALDKADLRRTYLDGADLGGASLFEAAVGSRLMPGRLPEGFPIGWSAPPAGWDLVEDEDGRFIGLRRVISEPAAAPSSPPQ
jgi:hypothetical protein